ncbi:LOW QUALITY PROTEIN: dnaJ homolog subfamily C member 1-like [Bacillus rossius redtenbacheri]|uniref:LOW QUALITY PROTEIN: dnaJ homolog subfamily C member 1-like n=1 Tax=Bacillus rossius redtenbacheri TaxID=93214 RepID=UPI002FDD6853
MRCWISWVFAVVLLSGGAHSWDNDDLEIFDLVEEINTNFYSLLGVEQDADASEIRRAYRRLSLVIHPDKSDAPDADVKFRQLAAVYDVLRDGTKRMRYNEVLRNGLPDWRQAVFYYRRVRKMGLAEMLVILSVLLTVGQYGVAWASYVEKKYNAEQYLSMKLKRLQKKVKKGKYDGPPLPETIELDIPSPSVWNTLPFQLPRFAWFCITMFPQSVRLLRQYLAERNQRREEETSSEEEVEVEVRPARRRKGKFAPPELGAAAPDPASSPPGPGRRDQAAEDEPPPVVSGGLWTDDDIVELIRLVKKFPQGIAGRWEKIAAAMCRPVGEVTHMARKVKEDGYRVGRPEDPAGEQPPEEPRKVKTKGGKLGVAGAAADEDAGWTQQQQKALEAALVRFPKGGALDRWEKIAKCVPGKTREECILRYKHLADVVKKRKENGDATETASL